MASFFFDTATGGKAAATNSGSSDVDNSDPSIKSGTAATVSGTTVTLSADNPDLSALVTSGANQSTIYLAQATNNTSAQKIFKITAFDNVAKTVTVDVAPTGVTSSSWTIGGRISWTTGALPIEYNLAGGDVVQFNANVSIDNATALITARASGTPATGWITLRGKAGSKVQIKNSRTTSTAAAQVLNPNGAIGWFLQNLDLNNQDNLSTSCNTVATNSPGFIFFDCKFSGCNASAHVLTSFAGLALCCEFTGTMGYAMTPNQGARATGMALFCNFHDITGNCIGIQGNTPATFPVMFSIFDTISGDAIQLLGAPTETNYPQLIAFNTFYNCQGYGVEANGDVDSNAWLIFNIFSNNGVGAGKGNVRFNASTGASGIANLRSLFNVYHYNLGSGGQNLVNWSASPLDITSDPQFADPANQDFRIPASSPAAIIAALATFPGIPSQFQTMTPLARGALQPVRVPAHVGLQTLENGVR